jgi:hypothetical protein
VNDPEARSIVVDKFNPTIGPLRDNHVSQGGCPTTGNGARPEEHGKAVLAIIARK